MARQERVCDVVQPELEGYRRTRGDRLGAFVAGAMADVEHPVRHACRCSVGCHVAQSDRQARRRPVDGRHEMGDRGAEDFETFFERCGVEDERAAIVFALISREFGPSSGGPERAPFSARCAGELRRGPLHGASAQGLSLETAVGQPQSSPSQARRRPASFGDPAPLGRFVERHRRQAVRHPRPIHRLVHDPGLDPLEPVVPPSDRLAEEVERRPRHAEMRVGVRPGADQPEPGNGQARKQPRHGVRVAVEPSSDRENGASDGVVVLAHGAMPPELVPPRMSQPILDWVVQAFESLEPCLTPAVAGQNRIGRPSQERQEGGPPVEHVRQQAAARVVHVVGIPVVSRAGRDDGFERGRAACRHHQRVEAAPRVAEHADATSAPALGGDPCKRGVGVLQLLGEILVAQQAV